MDAFFICFALALSLASALHVLLPLSYTEHYVIVQYELIVPGTWSWQLL